MFTNQTRAAPAARTDQLADDIADRIAIACHPDELEGLITDAWVKHRDGRLTANDLETLQEAALARMNAFPEGGPDTRPEPRPAPSGAPRAACRRPRPPRRSREKLFGSGYNRSISSCAPQISLTSGSRRARKDAGPTGVSTSTSEFPGCGDDFIVYPDTAKTPVWAFSIATSRTPSSFRGRPATGGDSGAALVTPPVTAADGSKTTRVVGLLFGGCVVKRKVTVQPVRPPEGGRCRSGRRIIALLPRSLRRTEV
jgi:hypothetical protein